MVILRLEIEDLRGMRSLTLYPAPGKNTLIGPGNSGKTAGLEALRLLEL